VFDVDRDQQLSRDELVTGIGHLLAIRRSHQCSPTANDGPLARNGGVVVGSDHMGSTTLGGNERVAGVDAAGDTREGDRVEETAEDYADSALKRYGVQRVSSVFVVLFCHEWRKNCLYDQRLA